jgi:hypothetical protein
MRPWVWVLANLGAACLVATGVDAGRVVSVSPACPPEASEMAIDYEGAKDACVAREPVTCRPGRTLAVDRKGNEDSCEAQDGAAEKPSCAHGRAWKPKTGTDECVVTAKPVCPRDFHLVERPGEDACVY